MVSGVQLLPSIRRKKYLPPNNLLIKQLTVAEIEILYAAIKENI